MLPENGSIGAFQTKTARVLATIAFVVAGVALVFCQEPPKEGGTKTNQQAQRHRKNTPEFIHK
jgi:hypothetical protein